MSSNSAAVKKNMCISSVLCSGSLTAFAVSYPLNGCWLVMRSLARVSVIVRVELMGGRGSYRHDQAAGNCVAG